LNTFLRVENLHIRVENKLVVKGATLNIEGGKVYALIGPNASGKTSLAMAILGHPEYEVVKGRIIFEGEDITNLPMPERVRRGLYVSFQNPPEIKGVKLGYFLERLMKRRYGKVDKNIILRYSEELGLGREHLERDLNVGFSGGERKRVEVLQLLLLKPKIAILDEPDSGVDIESLKVIASTIKDVVEEGTGVLVITHYRNILSYLKPSLVYVMGEAEIKMCGNVEILDLVERCGYSCILKGVCERDANEGGA